MTVAAQQSVRQFSRQLFQAAQDAFLRSDACGLILTACPDDNQNMRFLIQLQSYLTKHEPEFPAECCFDEQSRLLGIVLEGRKLAGAHYTSLVCKEFLAHYGLLDGDLVVAGFPEIGTPSEEAVSDMMAAVATSKGRSKEIRIFAGRPDRRDASSILVADTEEVSREFIRLKLESKGYEVYEARDGSEALEKYSLLAPDVVITELNLPVLDGYQLIRKIKEERDSEGKVIVLTEKQLTKDVNRAFELGASDYVTKPFSISELEWRIRRLQFS